MKSEPHLRMPLREPKSTSAMDAHDETGRRVPPPAASPASLAECALRRQTSEVGAECPNWARSDLCGGRSAMGVPTANSIPMPAFDPKIGIGGHLAVPPLPH